MALTTYIIAGVLVAGAYSTYHRTRQESHRKLPPGPKPLPLLGNITDFPPDGTPEHLHWLQHKDLYGGISSVTVMGMTMVLLHDKAMAHELLEKAASKTSGRPEMVMANKLCGYESIAVCQSYTPTFRRYRKLLHQELGTKASAAQFHSIQEDEVKRQLVRTLSEPGKWLDHCKTNAAASVLKMAYGYNIEKHKPDVLVNMVDQMMKEFSLAASPMAWAVDIIPALQHVPEGFPGASFKKTARQWRKSIQASAYLPYEFVQRQINDRLNKPSYVSKLIEQLATDGEAGLGTEDEEAIVWSAASLYGAAADTTVITLTAFTLAMVKYPGVQQKAQDEIDRVVGNDRLPTMKDRDNLPYVDALVKEASRWWPVSPMGFPHMATEEFDFEGYRIPKGALLLPAVWWFLHDPAVYADPEVFDPSRFLDPRNEPDPGGEAFGFGRRKCPGRFFADAGLYLNIAMTLATMHISRPVVDGKQIDVDAKPKPGVLTYPTPFGFSISPRSEKHRELIEGLERSCPFEQSDAELMGSMDSFQVRY